MLELPLVPLKGVGPITFGLSRSECRRLFARSGVDVLSDDTRPNVDFILGAKVGVEYEEETVTYVGVRCSPGRLRCTIRGQDVFDLPAPDLFAIFAQGEPEPRAFSYEAGQSFFFPEQVVTLWEPDFDFDLMGNCSRPIYSMVGLGDARYRHYKQSR